MPYPLPMLPTIPCDLNTLPPSQALALGMAFMKNTILRSLNNIHDLAPRFSSRDSKTLLPFLTYATNCCDIVICNIESDNEFFTSPAENGMVLTNVLGRACVQDMRGVLEKTKQLKAMLDKWIKTKDYDASKLLSALAFGDEIAQKMKLQVSAVDGRRVSAMVPEDVLGEMIQANVHHFAMKLDIEFLVPFVHSHHDRATSQYWPPMTAEGRQNLPALTEKFRLCWELAPYDCFSGKRK